MDRRKLGRTGIEVSSLCLGTMTFGTQTPERDAHRQIDTALAAGVDFIDTAEMYPVNPVRAETVGGSERILGNWIAGSGRRHDIVLATKHSGEGMAHFRNGARISSATIPGAIEGSLKRLQTDHIDLYQFHWPNRGSYMFRKNWRYDPTGLGDRAAIVAEMEDCLGALQREVARGTIRAFGLSNESAWGTVQWLEAAARTGGPRVACVQNEYSLLCRLYDTDMAETSVLEEVGLLAFSPLAAGFLTGKYQDGTVPEASRMTHVPEMGGRNTKRVRPAVDACLDIARRHGIDPVHMALAFVTARPFTATAIFGATTQAQLDRILAGRDLVLSQEILDELDGAHRAHPMPY